MDKETLLLEIQSALPIVPMPEIEQLRFHQSDCLKCNFVAMDLDEFRHSEISDKVFRYICDDMGCLSAQGWRWILPHYLPFCFTAKAEYDTRPTEFLIYNLGPDQEFEAETLQHLAELNPTQILCLIHFLQYLLNDEYWNEYCAEDIQTGINFLSKHAH